MLYKTLLGLGLAALAAGECTREQLLDTAKKYLAAQVAGKPDDLKSMLADDFKYQENNKAADVTKGVLSKALTLDHSRHIVDTTQCASYTELIATGGPYVVGTQLRHSADGSKVTLIDSIVATTGSWFFNAKTTLGYVKDEDWGVQAEAKRSPREKLKAAGDAYLDMWSNSSAKVSSPCTASTF
jgi:hypothetical protein